MGTIILLFTTASGIFGETLQNVAIYGFLTFCFLVISTAIGAMLLDTGT